MVFKRKIPHHFWHQERIHNWTTTSLSIWQEMLHNECNQHRKKHFSVMLGMALYGEVNPVLSKLSNMP
jgi:hypothetical protein